MHKLHFFVSKNMTNCILKPGAPIISVKVLNDEGEGTAADIMNGVQWIYEDFAAKKAALGNRAKGVINMSLGAQVVHQVMEASMLETFIDLGEGFPHCGLAMFARCEFECGPTDARIYTEQVLGFQNTHPRLP